MFKGVLYVSKSFGMPIRKKELQQHMEDIVLQYLKEYLIDKEEINDLYWEAVALIEKMLIKFP